MYVNLKGDVINKGDVNCQDVKVIQYVKDIGNADGSRATAQKASVTKLTTGRGWRVDAPTENPDFYLENTPFADLTGEDSTGFDFFDTPGSSQSGKKRGKRLMTCITARCRDKHGNVGSRKTIGCLEWGYFPKFKSGKIVDVKMSPETPIIHCGFPGVLEGAQGKWKKAQ